MYRRLILAVIVTTTVLIMVAGCRSTSPNTYRVETVFEKLCQVPNSLDTLSSLSVSCFCLFWYCSLNFIGDIFRLVCIRL